MLVTGIHIRPKSFNDGLLRILAAGVSYDGLLRDGTEIRTVEIHYSHSSVPLDELDTKKAYKLGDELLEIIRRDYPDEGDILHVYWYSPNVLPEPFGKNKKRYVQAKTEPEYFGMPIFRRTNTPSP